MMTCPHPRGGSLVATCCGCLALAVAGCGARSGLLVPDVLEPADVTAVMDAGSFTDAAVDASDVVFVPPPPICIDGGVQFIYVVTEQNNLYSYYPPDNAFHRIGQIHCTSDLSNTPNSMAVDRGGTAWVAFHDGEIFHVSGATAQCEPTPYAPVQLDITTFGMGFAADLADPSETLYIASTNYDGGLSNLGVIDTSAYTLSIVNGFPPSVTSPELTGTGDGHLYAFSTTAGGSSFVAEINRETAAIDTMWNLPSVVGGNGWAFASWGGAFYIFTAPTGTSTVTRFRPSDGTVSVIQSLDETIVGAGVSTCAPNR